MEGVISGLDMAEALLTFPIGCDVERAKRLLAVAEVHFVAKLVQIRDDTAEMERANKSKKKQEA